MVSLEEPPRLSRPTASQPTGKSYPDEPSGGVAVQSDFKVGSRAVDQLKPGIESDLTLDVTPGPSAEPAPKRDTPDLPGSFGRYEVRKTLGTGGYGAVYLGHDTQLDRPVAIKVLRGGSEVRPYQQEEFLQEARRLAQ